MRNSNESHWNRARARKGVLLEGEIKVKWVLGGSPHPGSGLGSLQKAVSLRSKASSGRSSRSSLPPSSALC